MYFKNFIFCCFFLHIFNSLNQILFYTCSQFCSTFIWIREIILCFFLSFSVLFTPLSERVSNIILIMTNGEVDKIGESLSFVFVFFLFNFNEVLNEENNIETFLSRSIEKPKLKFRKKKLFSNSFVVKHHHNQEGDTRKLWIFLFLFFFSSNICWYCCCCRFW